MADDVESGPRRPLRTRGRPGASALAGWLARRGVRPNSISFAGLAFAAMGGACLATVPHVGDAARIALLVTAALLIQLRLLSNLMDGMVAIEGGRQTRTGELFNEIPDRFADLFLLVGAGYAVTWISWGGALGWAAGAAALLTAYARLLGGALGGTQHFVGPFAKPHRMALLTAACLASTIEVAFGYEGSVLAVALGAIVAGSLVTFARRVRLIARELATR